jgi:lysophospholipase L1-like esterase
MKEGQPLRWIERLTLAVFAFVSILAALLILEGAARLRQYVKYGTARNATYSLSMDKETGLPIPTPGQITRFIRIDSRGFRNLELAVPKPAGTIRLAFLGASTTFCAEVSSNEATWPHLVWKSLREKWPDRKFDYINAGVPGYTVEDSLINLKARVTPLQPDVIVIYHATNDLSKDTRELAIQQGLYDGRAEDSSFLARHSLLFFLLEKNWQIAARERRSTVSGRHLEFEPAKLSVKFHQRLLALVEASREVAPVVAVATFSHQMRWEQPPKEQLQASNTSLYYMPYMSVEGILRGFDEYNRIIREVSHQAGIVLIDCEDRIPGDSRYFRDSVHFTDQGSAMMAQRVTTPLVDSPELQRLLASGNGNSQHK